MTSRHELWARLRRQLWQPPRAHGEQPRERVVGPLELFYDLVVVVLVAQAAHHLAGHLTWRGLGEFAAVFALVWIAWFNGSVLGETVTGVVDGLAHEPTSAVTLAVGLVAVVVGFGAWWTYFDFSGHRRPRPTRASTVQWMLVHLPLMAAVAAMGAAMVGLVEHAHDGRTPAATAWVLCGGAAVVLCATMVLATSLRVWRLDRRLYRPLARICVVAAVVCVGVGAARLAPLVLGLVLVLVLGVPWGFAVAYRLAHEEESAADEVS
ncbi:low temperature requirement protein A [Actinoallomurus liliacearum]